MILEICQGPYHSAASSNFAETRYRQTCDKSHVKPPDICYPEFKGSEFVKDDVDESYFSSSPRHLSPPLCTKSEPPTSSNADNYRYMPTTSVATTTTTRGEELEEFFGETFPGMEETFRSVLLQYFTQVTTFNRLSERKK